MRNRIKVRVSTVFLAAVAVLYGCTGMVQDELDQTRQKLQALQKLVESVNGQLENLNSVVPVVTDDSHTVIPGSLTETEDGYDLSFKDGKTIHIHFGTDGKDGEQIIPIGVRDAEDSLYYWTVDGQWLTDSLGNKIRVGAVDGKDGVVPQIKVEDDYWWISVDGGKSWEHLASCEEMNGVGVFKGIDLSDPRKIVLILWDGTELELLCQIPFKMSFSGPVLDTMLIAGGETISIPYEVIMEGETEEPVTVTSGTDGTYFPVLSDPGQMSGVVQVTAPETFSEGYILLSAYCGGYSAVKMISFLEREITPAEKYITIRHEREAGTREIPYSANFEYVVSSPGVEWLQIDVDPETGVITFSLDEKTGSTVRSCIVTVSPEDNPDYACTTFEIIQATNGRSYTLEPGSPFTFNALTMTLDVPEEGGDAVFWITSEAEMKAFASSSMDWATAETTLEDGFYKVAVHVDANDSGEARTGYFDIRRRIGSVFAPIGEHININQR